MKRNKLTPEQRAKAKYEAEKRGRVIMRVQLSSRDDEAAWEKMQYQKADLSI